MNCDVGLGGERRNEERVVPCLRRDESDIKSEVGWPFAGPSPGRRFGSLDRGLDSGVDFGGSSAVHAGPAMGPEEDVVGEECPEALFEVFEIEDPIRRAEFRDVLEGSPEAFEPRGGVDVLLGCESETDSELGARFSEDLRGELGALVGDQVLRGFEGSDGALEEFRHHGSCGFAVEGLYHEGRSGVAIEHRGRAEVEVVEERLDEGRVHHPDVGRTSLPRASRTAPPI